MSNNDEGVFYWYAPDSGEDHNVCNEESEEELCVWSKGKASLFRGVENWD